MSDRRISSVLYAALLGLLVLGSSVSVAQLSAKPDRESDPAVLKKLDWFQDQKFGLLMHWGPYSQWGVVESWSICSEDEPWCRRNLDNYDDYVKKYEGLKNTFNPVKFDPDRWAAAAKYAGMKYVIFTTKHHDGFCMFDTKQTDYRITDAACPFSVNPRANVAKEIFGSFRKAGFGVGAYFSKPDWHNPNYWNPYWAHGDRNVNYTIANHPDIWKKFAEYTYNQIEELMTRYGSMDILWLDGGWVNPGNKGQDIDMPKIAEMARSHQPGLIVVDRAVGGRYENYRTPEQQIPDKPLDYVWETCMTMGNSWSYVPNDAYKPTRTLIHLLVDVVAKGGNFLLNIGPSPEGELPPISLQRLKEIGDWMKVNGSAIFATRPIAPYKENNISFTEMQNGSVNAIYLVDEKQESMPEKIVLESLVPAKGTDVFMLGVPKALSWERAGNGVVIVIPASVRNNPPCKFAWTFRIEKPEILVP